MKSNYEKIQEMHKDAQPIVYTREGRYINIVTGEDVTEDLMKNAIKIDENENLQH